MAKGKTNNPNGAPHKYETWGALINNYSIKSIDDLEQINLREIPSKTAIVIKQIMAAYEEGDPRVLNWLADRSDGKPHQFIETKQEIVSETPLGQEIKKLREGK